MTGEEYLHLTDGDLCKLTEDIYLYTADLTWHKGDIIEVVFRNSYEETIYVKNNSIPYGNKPSYKELGALVFFTSMELYKKWNEVKKNTFVTKFEHKFMPGDTVWYMKDNKPFKDYILAVHYKIVKGGDKWFYTLASESALLQDDGLFATKEELLKSFL